VRADRADPAAYDGVAGRDWDEVVELSYSPPLVTGALEALATRARHWTLVSTISVYASNSDPGADEDAALLPPDDPEDYGAAKVAAELACRQVLGDRLLVARSGLIGGPGDGSDRFGYWVSRFALAQERGDGPVLVPPTEGRWGQVVDVDDLATWLAAAGQAGQRGTVNATGDSHPLQAVLELAAQVAGYRGQVVTASDDWLLERGVGYWAGPRSLPLWVPLADAAVAQRATRALRASLAELVLELSPLGETMQRTLADERSRGLDRDRRSGLTRDEELELVARLA
jgi:nucleoside-diphosphate-sugar epimerase